MTVIILVWIIIVMGTVVIITQIQVRLRILERLVLHEHVSRGVTCPNAAAPHNLNLPFRKPSGNLPEIYLHLPEFSHLDLNMISKMQMPRRNVIDMIYAAKPKIDPFDKGSQHEGNMYRWFLYATRELHVCPHVCTCKCAHVCTCVCECMKTPTLVV